ncbi:hypothetical protein A3A03_03950 [Candidatus Nomurabacteria bacterium RIFCSPLOWO2_01_FULL_40_18]|uniref:Uncharacterized protein n=1 Tax=Candidatus Nomurabacteria bacterium RIFCSPLOWO2_01_FULL_40_18 TaxID=1801773 RepID=A0A1F6XK43_9BACT|nr:MAG: hypothetical protein A3A03_03950 [Candidatus Nomurabacteria bacterium RIFCSPLOWO2_01_FULL_40_18]
MKEGKNPLFSTNPIARKDQEKFDQDFLVGAGKAADKEAIKRFNTLAKKIALNEVYTKEYLEFFFNLKWEKFESMLKERFEFKVDGKNITFIKVKE